MQEAVKAVLEVVSVYKVTMATYMNDPYIFNLTREIRYLKSILTTLRPLEIGPNSDLAEVNRKQEKILNTLRYDFSVKLTDLEQRIRKNTVRVFGIPESPGEEEDVVEVVLNFFLRNLKIVLIRSDIKDTYRVGKFRKSQPRPVVVRFASDAARKRIWKRRHMVQNLGVGIYEELCPERIKIMKQAKQIFGKHCVAVEDGVIVVETQNRKFEKFLTLAQFEDFLKQHGVEVHN